MWYVITKADEEKLREQGAERLRRSLEEARKKQEAREAHQKSTCCPHCGRSDPLPPWLQ